MGMLKDIYRKARAEDRMLISAALGIYLFFSLTYLHLPGLEYDETLFVNAALGDVDGTFVSWKIEVLGKTVPLMLMNYIGALKAWLYAPLFSVFSGSAYALRLPMVLLGLASLCVTYALVRRFMGRGIALIALFILGTDPTFIFAIRQDWGPAAISMLLRLSSLYLFRLWIEKGSLRHAVLGSSLLGLGVYDKTIFLWFAAGLCIALLFCFRSRLEELTGLRAVIGTLLGFAAGCLPWIAFNLTHRFLTFQGHGFITHQWREYLAQRIMMFQATLDGSMIYYLQNLVHLREPRNLSPAGNLGFTDTLLQQLANLLPVRGTFLAGFFLVALAYLLILVLMRRLRSPRREVIFILVQILVIIGFICILEEASGPHHMIMLYPFPHIIVAVALWEVTPLVPHPRERRNRFLRVAAIFGGAMIVLSQVVVDAEYLRTYKATGGAGNWSAAIYDLARYADQNPGKTYRLMDWGFSNQLLLLCRPDRLKKQETFVHLVGVPEEEKKTRLRRLISDRDSLFVFHVPPFETYPIHDWFFRTLEGLGSAGHIVRTFHQGDGRPIYILYSFRD